jgi:hypothetical protein
VPRYFLLFLLAVGLFAQEAPPAVGIIDYYGIRKVSKSRIEAALGMKEGDRLPRSKGEVEMAIEEVPGVVAARLEAVCCDEGQALLYVGIEERGATRFTYHDLPEGADLLPRVLHDAYVEFLACLNDAVRAGDADEDLSQGHSLLHNAACRARQERFIDLAKEHEETLQKVIRNSFDEEHRAIAAYVIGYHPNKQEAIPHLLHAMRDPDDTVRNNSMRALAAIAILAAREPDRKLNVAPTWFIEMLGSLIWSDRRAALMTLLTLTEHRDEDLLSLIRQRSTPELREMALWKYLPHALPAFILLGRTAGIPEEEIQKAWESGDRAKFVERATARKR